MASSASDDHGRTHGFHAQGMWAHLQSGHTGAGRDAILVTGCTQGMRRQSARPDCNVRLFSKDSSVDAPAMGRMVEYSSDPETVVVTCQDKALVVHVGSDTWSWRTALLVQGRGTAADV